MPTRTRVLDFKGENRDPARVRVLEFRADTDTTPRPRVRILEFLATTTPAPRRRILEFLATTSIDLQGNAGSDQSVEALQRVYLSGLASGGPATHFHWEQTDGLPLVQLEPSADVPQPSFLAPATDAGTVLKFELTVSDDNVPPNRDTSPDSVAITVVPHIDWVFLNGTWLPVIDDAEPVT